MTGAMYTYISARLSIMAWGFMVAMLGFQCKPIPYMSIIDLSQPNLIRLILDFWCYSMVMWTWKVSLYYKKFPMSSFLTLKLYGTIGEILACLGLCIHILSKTLENGLGLVVSVLGGHFVETWSLHDCCSFIPH